MSNTALFGNSAWIVIGLGVALIVIGLFLKAKTGNSSISLGWRNTTNQSIQINGGGPPQGGSGWQSWLNVLSNICTVAGMVMASWQSFKVIG